MKKLSIYIQALTFSALIFLLLSGILFWVTDLIAKQLRDQQIIDASYQYLNFNNSLESFIISHSNILYGFAAYINTFDDLDDENVYEYLNNLLKDNSPFIRNVGILKDTTIHWNYPREDNIQAIGVDLATIEAQAPLILKVKNQNVNVFHGPVNLVQGGIGYIIRIPIRKDNQYWGQASIVLDGDKFIQFMDKISNEARLDVLVRAHNDNHTVMYGTPDILKQNPITLTRETDFGLWDISYLPRDNGTNPFYSNIILVVILGGLIILGVCLFVYKYILKNLLLRNQNKSLSKTATTDRLTGIFNREMLERYIYSELDRADKLGYDMSLIFFDLDHFKRVNDNYGHDAGDRVLVNTVARAKDILRTSDFFVRWGGEEFLIIMPGGNLNNATRIAEKLRREIAEIVHEGVGQVTISLGIAQRLELEFWSSWFKRGDKALYQAKEGGRNRLFISVDSLPIKKELSSLNWKKEWNCGNPTIDQQHKQLMLDANKLIDLFKTDKIQYKAYFNQFIKSLKKHFKFEEEVLQKVEYPFLDEHRRIHSHLINRIHRTKESLEKQSSSPDALFEYILEEILIGHFLQEDLKFFNYINTNETRP